MSKGKPRSRTARRVIARAQAKPREALERAQARLAEMSPGGRFEHPISVASSVLVERRALEHACLQCSGAMDVVAHDAQVRGEARRRVVETKCQRCGALRRLWFEIVEPLEN